MKITTKGQVTIPQDIRERHGFLPGTEVVFVDDGKEVRLMKATEERRRGRLLVARMRGRADTSLTTDEIMALTRGPEAGEDVPLEGSSVRRPSPNPPPGSRGAGNPSHTRSP
jgi:AbrB family looped-hinge helix DNA binding protein